MSLKINLLKLELDPLTRITVYRRFYESSTQLNEIHKQLESGQFVTRLGDKVWGYLLPEPIIEQYKFRQFSHLAVTLEPRFMNSLLRYAIRQRLEQLNFQKVGWDKFELPGDVAFTVGDQSELVAKPLWLVRPFSLPSDTSNIFTLLINPRLTYKFKFSLAQLSSVGFHWREFGDKVRALTADNASQEHNLWENAHTALIVEEKGVGGLLCEWRDGDRQKVDLAHCWPLASAENRYRYLKQRYLGYKGEQLAKEMKTHDDNFFELKSVIPRVESLREQIESLELGVDLKFQLGDFLALTEIDRQVADDLQSSLLIREPKDILPEGLEEETDEEEDPKEYEQL